MYKKLLGSLFLIVGILILISILLEDKNIDRDSTVKTVLSIYATGIFIGIGAKFILEG